MNRGLLVGINAYPGNELQGCINDVTTTSAILDRLNWLIDGAKAGDRLVFHYSGHGAQFPIRDKEFNKIFSALHKGVDLTWVSDSCHSGDLARDFMPPKQKSKAMPMPADIRWRMRTADTAGVRRMGFEHVLKNFNAILVSGCGQLETSADAEIEGRYNGALTYYLLKTLHGPNGLTQPLESAVARTRAALQQNGYSQHPELQGSAELMTLAFLATERKKKVAAA